MATQTSTITVDFTAVGELQSEVLGLLDEQETALNSEMDGLQSQMNDAMDEEQQGIDDLAKAESMPDATPPDDNSAKDKAIADAEADIQAAQDRIDKAEARMEVVNTALDKLANARKETTNFVNGLKERMMNADLSAEEAMEEFKDGLNKFMDSIHDLNNYLTTQVGLSYSRAKSLNNQMGRLEMEEGKKSINNTKNFVDKLINAAENLGETAKNIVNQYDPSINIDVTGTKDVDTNYEEYKHLTYSIEELQENIGLLTAEQAWETLRVLSPSSKSSNIKEDIQRWYDIISTYFADESAKNRGHNDIKKQFVLDVVRAAIYYEKIYDIPAEIMIMQAMEESGWGSKPAFGTLDGTEDESKRINLNNYFGIKSYNENEPRGYVPTHEEINGVSVPIFDWFKKYDSVGDSFKDHFDFLERNDYRPSNDDPTVNDWLDSLKEKGYATAENYKEALQDVGNIFGFNYNE